MREHNYYVYIMTNEKNTTLYTGVCNNLERRLYEHKHYTNPSSFTAKYKLKKLVYYEEYSSIDDAIAREKQIKNGSRAAKIRLIEKDNKEWEDLSENW